MKLRASIAVLCLAVAVTAFFSGFLFGRNEGIAFSQTNGGNSQAIGAPPQPVPSRLRVPSPRSFGPVAISATTNSVFVVYDAAVYKFDATNMKLVSKTPLYEEENKPE